MVWQFNTIFKSPIAFRSLYHESGSCPSASQALPISARQTRYCRVEPKARRAHMADQVKTRRVCFSLPLIPESEPRQAVHDLC